MENIYSAEKLSQEQNQKKISIHKRGYKDSQDEHWNKLQPQLTANNY